MPTRSRQEILVLHPGALGDILQSVPALRVLRRTDAGARITFAGQPRLGQLLVGTGVVDAARSFDGLGLEHLFSEGPLPLALQDRLQSFDRVVSWFGSRAGRFPARLGTAAREVLIGPPVPPAESQTPVWRHLLEMVAPRPDSGTEPVEPLAVPDDWRLAARRVLAGAGRDADRPLLFVHPGTAGAWKLWPPSCFAAVVGDVVARTGCQVLIHRGPADRDAAEELSRLLGREVPLWLVEPRLELLAGVLVEADAYLGGDAGVSHLAAGVGTHAVLVFPAATLRQWAPWSPSAISLRGDDRSIERAAVSAIAQRLVSSR